MADVSVEYVGDTPDDISNRLSAIGSGAGGSTNDALLETAEDVKDKLEETSPVDTGEYEDSWYIQEVSEGEVWVLNEADHARYVMLPNSVMIGSAKADLPVSGVLHNTKGIARSEANDLNANVSEQIEDLLQSLSGRR